MPFLLLISQLITPLNNPEQIASSTTTEHPSHSSQPPSTLRVFTDGSLFFCSSRMRKKNGRLRWRATQQQQRRFQGFFPSGFFLLFSLFLVARIFSCGFCSLADFPINFQATLECHSVVFERILSSSFSLSLSLTRGAIKLSLHIFSLFFFSRL
jgi:hypothetical protein